MRLGDLDALKATINNAVDEEIRFDQAWAIGLKYSLKLIDNAPTVEPEPYVIDSCDMNVFEPEKYMKERPQGEWNEWTDERWGGTTIYCPYCKENALEEYRDGLLRQVKSNFCPNCGSDMRKEGEEE